MRPLLIILLISFSIHISAQDIATAKQDTVYTKVEVMPEYPGGDGEMMKFIQKNLSFPSIPESDDEIPSSRLVLSFIVNQDGSLSDIAVKKPVYKTYNAEAIRVVKLFPKFKPGEHNGVPVRVQLVLPMMFCTMHGQ